MNKVKRKENKLKKRIKLVLTDSFNGCRTNNWDPENGRSRLLPLVPALDISYHRSKNQTRILIIFNKNVDDIYIPGRLDKMDAEFLLHIVNSYVNKPRITPRKEKMLLSVIKRVLDCYEPI